MAVRADPKLPLQKTVLKELPPRARWGQPGGLLRGAVTHFCPLNISSLKLTYVQRTKGVKEERVADSEFLFRQPLPSGAE